MSDTESGKYLTEESPSVQSHLGIIQGVIDRMATNSTSAKSWCITIVSAILVVIADKNKPDYAFLALIPTLLFLALDVYYLAMEKGVRNSYDKFVKKVHSGTLTADDLYLVHLVGGTVKLRWAAFKSFSVWGFYLGLVVLIILAKHFVLA
jgi:hypothetical protein